MNLPKRDGLHGRYYLIHKPETAPEVLAEADVCIQDVLDGPQGEPLGAIRLWCAIITERRSCRASCWSVISLTAAAEGFPYDAAAAFCDARGGWRAGKRLATRWTRVHRKKTYLNFCEKRRERKLFLLLSAMHGFPEPRPGDVDENLLRFVCYAAVCHTVYGISCESVTTKHLLGLVSQLRPDMVKELKENGSGKLPPGIQKRKTKHLTASANDAFATIRITARDCTEGCCEEALSYLAEVLEQPDFPRSYSIEFRGPEKIYLPIPGLPKKGVNQLFACAVRYPRLHGRIEHYARLAMRKDEWYNNLDGEVLRDARHLRRLRARHGRDDASVAEAGLRLPRPLRRRTFVIAGEIHPRLFSKIRLHSADHARPAPRRPVHAGASPREGVRRTHRQRRDLDALLAAKRRLADYLPEESEHEKEAQDYLWRGALWAIWGKESENGGKVINAAPEELKEKYRRIFEPIRDEKRNGQSAITFDKFE